MRVTSLERLVQKILGHIQRDQFCIICGKESRGDTCGEDLCVTEWEHRKSW